MTTPSMPPAPVLDVRKMTAAALLVLVALLALSGLRFSQWQDASTPPAGVQVHEVTVTEKRGWFPGEWRKDPDYQALVFERDGVEEIVRYEERWVDGIEPGDTIEVYRDPATGAWRTTLERSLGDAIEFGLFALVPLAMIVVFGRLRRRVDES